MDKLYSPESKYYDKDLLQLLSKNLPDMLWVKDLEGRYLYVNEAICNELLMANDIDEPIGKNDIFFAERERKKHKDVKDWHTFGELCFDSDLEVLSQKRAMRFEEYGNIKGKMVYLEVNKAPFYDDKGNILGTVGSGRNVTDYKTVQLELENEKYKLKESQRIANVGSWEVDLLTDNVIWSDTLYTIYNVDPSSFTPSLETYLSFMSDEDAQKVQKKITQAIDEHIIVEMPYTIKRRDGTLLHVLSRAEAIYNEKGDAVKIMGSTMDITDSVELKLRLQKQKEAFEFQANHDYLTQLPNRVLFVDRLEQSIHIAKRNKTKIALLFIDLDHFKKINDSLGHTAGDKVLVEIARRMQNKIRASDSLARLGGDEFCIILNGIKDVHAITSIVKSGMKIVEKPIIVDSHELYVGMSVGISIYPKDGETSTELLKNADTAMYRAKNSVQNSYAYYDQSLSAQSLEYLTLESAMRHGLENGEFIPYFQPQIDIKDNTLIGVELLVRWQHPTKGLIPPDEFIPIAEKTGYIIELDRYLMNRAMSLFMQWKNRGLDPGILSINLAAKQLDSDTFLSVLKEMMHAHSCPAACLELEVTESEIMRNAEVAIVKLQQIHDLGIALAIDDFGTGYSSLSYLKRFPIDKLKIDRSFIMDIPTDNEDKEITKMIIGLCKILGIKALAEGVETEEQMRFLKDHKCHYVQGYLYAKPMNADDMMAFLQSKS